MSAAGQDLTLLHGVGRKRAALFRSLGVRGYEDLLHRDLRELRRELNRHGAAMSMSELEGLRFHARSYLDDRPLLFGSLPTLGDAYLAFDLEYDPFQLIWLIGVLVVEGDELRHIHLWADDLEAERLNLETLARILRGWSPRPVMTWGGLSADLPQLRQAARWHGVVGMFRDTFRGHVDLLAHCEKGLRLPIPGLGLGAVSSFFGFEAASPIRNGLEALRLYDAYLESSDPEAKARLRSDLVVYNGDDLRGLVATERALRELASPPRPAARPREPTGA